MKKIILLLALLLCPLSANAAYWYEYAEKSYIDLDSLKKTNQYAFAWVKILNKGTFEPINNKKVWYVLNTIYVDFKNNKTAIKDVYFYDLDNKMLENYTLDELKWEIIVPDSMADSLYNVVDKYPRFETYAEKELWVDISDEIQLDILSLLMTNSECCNMWLKVYKKKPKTPNAKTKFVKTFLSVNLVENKFAVLDVIEYNKNGKIVKATKYDNLNYIVDDENYMKPVVDYIKNLEKRLRQSNDN